jgi:hypothetical protein
MMLPDVPVQVEPLQGFKSFNGNIHLPDDKCFFLFSLSKNWVAPAYFAQPKPTQFGDFLLILNDEVKRAVCGYYYEGENLARNFEQIGVCRRIQRSTAV